METILQYFNGFIITVLTVVVLNLFGAALSREKRINSYSFVLGYIVYSFLVAIVGIPIQIMNLPWLVFFWYMIILLVSILSYIVYMVYSKKLEINLNLLKEYISKHWFLYIGAVLITFYSLTHLSAVWSNNLTDDSYYINKMASLPYLENPFHTDYVTGFMESGFFNTYMLNTFELEASFYIYISQIKATLYARLFLSLLNYFILLNLMHAFTIKVLSKNKLKEKKIQYYIPLLFIVFAMCSHFFVDSEASWTVRSAAYFGSTLVRIGGVFVLLLPIIDKREIDLSAVVTTAMSCVVLISKSTVAVPLIFLVGVGYLLSLIKNKKGVILFFLLIGSLFVVGYVLPNNEIINQYTFVFLKKNILKPFFISAIIISLLLSRKIKLIKNINLIMICSILLVTISEINDVFELSSNYQFVADRTLYSLFVFYMVTIYSFSIVFISNKFIKITLLNAMLGISATAFVLVSIFVTKTGGAELLNAVKIYAFNPYLIPQSTVELGETLEAYYQETGNQLKVFMQAGVVVDQKSHFTAAILRSFTPHTISPVGSIRTQSECSNENSEFYGYSIDDLSAMSQFYVNPSNETLAIIEEINTKYPFNCIIGQNFGDVHDSLLETIGYTKYKDLIYPYTYQPIEYSIYIRK